MKHVSSEYPRLYFRNLALVFLTSIVSIAIFAFIGHWLDVSFDTYPKFLIAGLVISFICTNLITFYRLNK